MSFSQKDSTKINQLLDEAYSFEANEPLKALKIYKIATQLSTKTNYHLGTFRSLQYSGIVHSDLSNYDSAIYYYRKAIPFSQLIDYKKGIASTYINIGNAYQFKGKLDSVVGNYMKGIKVFEILQDSSDIGQSYANLATLFGSINQSERQIYYLEKALKMSPRDNFILKGYVLNDLGQVFLKDNKHNEAFEFFTKADNIAKSIDNPQLTFFITRNFGEYFLKMKLYEKATSQYEEALYLVNNLNEVYYKNDLLLQLGETHLLRNDPSKAIEYFSKALNFSIEKEILSLQMKAHFKLSKVYHLQEKHQTAYDHLAKYATLKDSILNLDHLKRINELEKQYQSEKKDKEIIETQNALQHNELQLAKKKNQFAIATFSGILLLFILLTLWYFYTQRQKLKNIEITKLEKERDISKLQALIEGEEKERARLAQDLHDGINGDLSSLKFQLSSISIESLSTENKIFFNKAIEMIDNSCDQVRNISHNLSPTTINDFGLVTSLKNYCAKLEGFHSIKINFQYFGNELQLSKNIETVIYRIVQELVNNIIKHAEATEALVQINSHDDNLFITVEDNGKGLEQINHKSGIGLKNIASRIAFLNGTLEEEHNKNGTTFTINIDLKNIPKT
jgi:signal transduction histidine kinase